MPHYGTGDHRYEAMQCQGGRVVELNMSRVNAQAVFEHATEDRNLEAIQKSICDGQRQASIASGPMGAKLTCEQGNGDTYENKQLRGPPLVAQRLLGISHGGIAKAFEQIE